MMAKREAYSKPCQTSKIELFTKTVNGWKLEAAHYIQRLDTASSWTEDDNNRADFRVNSSVQEKIYGEGNDLSVLNNNCASNVLIKRHTRTNLFLLCQVKISNVYL